MLSTPVAGSLLAGNAPCFRGFVKLDSVFLNRGAGLAYPLDTGVIFPVSDLTHDRDVSDAVHAK